MIPRSRTFHTSLDSEPLNRRSIAIEPKDKQYEGETYSQYLKRVSRGRPDLEKVSEMLDEDYPDCAWEAKLAIVDFSADKTPAFKEIDISEEESAVMQALQERDENVGIRLIILFDSFGESRSKRALNTIGACYDIGPFDVWQHVAAYRGCAYLPSESSISPLEIVVSNGIGTAVIHTAKDGSCEKTIILLYDLDKQELQNPHLAERTDLYCTRGFPIPPRERSRKQSMASSESASPNDLDYEAPLQRSKLAFLPMSPAEVNDCIKHPILTLLPLMHRGLLDHSQLLHRSTNLSMTRQHRYSTYQDSANFEARQAFFANGTLQKLGRCKESLELHRDSPWLDEKQANTKAVCAQLDIQVRDHCSLIERTGFLRALIESQATRNLGLQSVEEAKEGLIHAKSVTRLTRLAFVFIPLSFSTSVFGMNIKGWQEEKAPHIALFAIFTVVTTILTILFLWITTIWDNYRQLQVLTEQSYWSYLVREISWKSKLLAVFFVLYSMFHSAEKTCHLAQALGLEIHGSVWDGSSCQRYLSFHQVDPMQEFWNRLGHPIFNRWQRKERQKFEANVTIAV